MTLWMPWPLKHFLLGQFPGEFEAQRQVMMARSEEASG